MSVIKTRPQPKRYLIDWIDSCSRSGWHDDTTNRASRCQSIGFVVAEDDQAVTLALSRASEDGMAPWCDAITIPKTAIKRKRNLR